jgi:uncharacterized protein (TIGR02246 family)
MEDDKAAVLAALDSLDDALARHDLDAALDLCTEDVVFIGSGAGEEAIGRDAIGPMFKALAPHLEGLEFSLAWDSVDVTVLGDIALLAAWGTAKLLTAHRNETVRYRFTGVLVRAEGRWLWRIHHGSEPGGW